MSSDLPLGLAGQASGRPTIPQDKGDDTQERFRYQWAIGLILIANDLQKPGVCELWCEHHEDFLLIHDDGTIVAIQVKTDGNEGSLWKMGSAALLSSLGRFSEFERENGERIARYEFCSNTACYVPGATTVKEETLASSPLHLIEAIKSVADAEGLKPSVKAAFERAAKACNTDHATLSKVLRKLVFRQGPTLRDYDAVLSATVVPLIPGCSTLNLVETTQVRDRLLSLVQNACRLRRDGVDSALCYVSNSGQPEAELRAKRLTLALVLEAIGDLKESSFRFVECGLRRSFEGTTERASKLSQKMSSAYIGTQFESLMWRMHSTERRMLERAHANPDNFEEFSNQIQGVVLTVCKDAEAKAFDVPDPTRKGPQVFGTILRNLEKISGEQPHDVGGESVHTLMGVAGMLSGECRFSWGVPLEGTDHGT